MKNLAILLIILVLAGLSLLSSLQDARAGDEPNSLFEQANEAYGQANYEQAILLYEKVTRLQGFSASVLYNLGNSYSRNGQIGKAILSYERARRLGSADPDIEGNLQHIKKAHGLFQTEPSFTDRFVALLGMNGWSRLAAFSLVLLTLSLGAALFLRKFKAVVFILFALGGLTLLVISAWAVFAGYPSWQAAIVVEPKARLFISPFRTAAAIGTIREGRPVHVGQSHAGFSYVSDETGRSGWIDSSSIESIILRKNRR